MAAGYSKEFLIAAYTFRFDEVGSNSRVIQENAEKLYDLVGKNKFRQYASLDAAELARFKKFCLEHDIVI